MSIPDTQQPSTGGIELRTRSRFLAEAVELLSSMRFAISLLTLIAIAATIGTVLKQNEPMPNYVNQFGPFWFEVFARLNLYALYSSWWFLLIMGFLVLSTSLCIVRNAPKMMKDMRSWRLNVREQSLRNFHHHAEWTAPHSRAALADELAMRVRHAGYQVKVQDKDGATLIAAKQGAGNKFGYIFAHSAIVIICLGGLLDSDLPIRMQQWWGGKTPFAGNGVIAEIPAQHRLPLSNPSYRGNTMIAEGSASSTAVIPQASGVLLQDLPFTIYLKRFVIDFYSTGMPKLFASEVTVKDHATGKTFDATIKVNEPLIYQGIAVYQSSFEDGGSKLQLLGYPMSGAGNQSFDIKGEVGSSTPLTSPGQANYTVEWSGFRPFNVENMASNQDLRAVKKAESFNEQFAQGLDKHSGSAGKNANNKDLKNVGPSVQYKLRDATGQAREFQNYMQPVELEGVQVFLAGVRDTPDAPFNYLRIPADDNYTMNEWMRIRAALQQPELVQLAAQRYAERALPAGAKAPGGGDAATMRQQLQISAARSLGIFAGDGKAGGYMAVSNFLQNVPEAEREKTALIFMKILNGSLWDLWQAAREKAGLPHIVADEKHARFLEVAGNAISDSFFYRAPVLLQLQQFEQVKASVLQVTRSPGKKIVYFGCLLLVLGVFAMFYIRERRVWIWLRDGEDGGAHALMAMSAQRKTLDFETEYTTLAQQLRA
ncbi:MAG TPA: cytochrome c biogenesis protein ResB [Burkholderiaceae bacterium]